MSATFMTETVGVEIFAESVQAHLRSGDSLNLGCLKPDNLATSSFYCFSSRSPTKYSQNPALVNQIPPRHTVN